MPRPSSRRRTTLGAVNTNRRTSMGPSAAEVGGGNTKKQRPKTRSRVSMAPRVSGGEHPTASSSSNSNGTGTPSRRKSVGGTDRRKSLAPPTLPTMKTDPRPITDKSCMNSSIRSLMSYLVSTEYEYPVSHKILARPSGKDFNHIVTFLLRRVDPTFNDGTMKLEDEVALAFKALGYPFPISKTALVAAGSPHTWPALLAALTWLIELLQCEEADTDDVLDDDNIFNGDDEKQPFESLEQLAVKTERAFCKYVGEAYMAFLNEDDARTESLENELVDFFESDNMVIEREIERVTDLNAGLAETIANLGQKAEGLPELNQKREDYATDLEKFHELVKQLNEHKSTLAKKVKDRTIEFDKINAEVEKITSKVKSLKETIESQELSLDDVRKMKNEKIRVEEGTKRATIEKQNLHKTMWQNEMELAKALEQLEFVVGPYNNEARVLQLIPETAPNAKGKKFMIEICKENAAHEDDQSLLLGGVSVNSKVIPALSSLNGEYLEQTVDAKHELQQLLDQEEASAEAVTEASDGIKIIEAKKKKSEETLHREKDEQERSLAVRLREIEATEIKVNSIRDPVALEEAIARYQRQCTHLESLRLKHQEENVARKKAVLDEFNAAVRFCAEHKEYQQWKLAELEEYVLRQGEDFDDVEAPAVYDVGVEGNAL